MPNQVFKPVSSTISTRIETNIFQNLNGSALTYSLCDRTDLLDKGANYFVSFNLPAQYSALPSGSTLALSHPELLQLNVDRIVIIPIPSNYYDQSMDGRSFTITVPQFSGATGISAKTLISSTYSTLQKKDNSILVGGNIAFLFSDDINPPYTGTTNGMSHSSVSSWNATPFVNRPAAVPYSDLVSTDINTDKRPFILANYAFPITSTFPTNTNQGYNYDVPVGYISLDKGFIIITHPLIVNNIPFSLGYQQCSNLSNLGNTNIATSGTNIYFTSTTTSQSVFTDIDVSFKTSVVCLALPQEFFFTNNPSWDLQKNVNELNNGTNGFDSVLMTEVGLYNQNNELIAIAKLSEPVEKTYTNLLTLNLDIEV